MSARIKRLVSLFGSQTKLAEAVGVGQSTVGDWVSKGAVPAKWQAKVIAAAANMGEVVTPEDLVSVTLVSTVAPPMPEALYAADLSIGDEDPTPSIACYVLSDGRRVISRTSALGALAGGESHTLGGDLAAYVKHVSSYLRVNLEDELIEFKLDNVNHKRVFGVTAECFLEICRAYVRARDADGLLTDRQREIARNANAFLAACANVGLIALIDEATGYQYQRADDALRIKLRAYLEDEMRSWEKTFPDELWIEFGRLTGWQGSVQHRPKYWGKLVNELVYSYLDPDVFDWLKSNAPPPRHGQNYHQWLSANFGLKKLVEHIYMLIGMASACRTMDELRYRMAEKFGKQPFQLLMFIDPPGLARRP